MQQSGLNHSVTHRRDAQRSLLLTSELLDIGPTNLLRAVGIGLELALDAPQLWYQASLELSRRDVIHSCGSVIGNDVPSCRMQVDGIPNFITECVPSSSSHPALECCQHAIRPNRSVRPGVNNGGAPAGVAANGTVTGV